jgi:excinuclease UvrABC ATPase subunit
VRRGKVFWRGGARRQPVSVPTGHCDRCGGDGFLELSPLPSGKMACPACRHDYERFVAEIEKLSRP